MGSGRNVKPLVITVLAGIMGLILTFPLFWWHRSVSFRELNKISQLHDGPIWGEEQVIPSFVAHHLQADWIFLFFGITTTVFVSLYVYTLLKRRRGVECALEVRTLELKEREREALDLSRENMTLAHIARIVGSTLTIHDVYESLKLQR